MADNGVNQGLEKYLQDIATIKDLLSDVDKRPLYEPWVFYVWGGLVAAGTLIHYLVERELNLPIAEIFLKVWLPVVLGMGFFELLAFIRNLSRHSLPFFSRSLAKLYASLTGSLVALVFIVLLFLKLDAIEQLPVVILLAGAVIYFILAQRSAYVYLSAHGFLLILLALLFYLLEIEHHTLSLIVGSLFAVSLIIAGFTAARMGKKEN